MALEAGTLLGKYQVLGRIGEGGMASVFEAQHVRLGHRVAIKVLLDELVTDSEIVARFEREGRALSRLKSPNVVRVVDVDALPSGAPYLVMEHLDGHDVADELAQRGRLPVVDAVDIVLQAANAMIEAHAAGLVHRDLKPSNLFLAKVADGRVVKVLDFGIALDGRAETSATASRLTRKESIMGTPLYMSPEQFRSTRDVDGRADVWALGASLYEMLCGEPPFVGTTTTIGVAVVTEPLRPLGERRADVPVSLVAVVTKALAKDPDERFQAMRDFAEALSAFGSSSVAVINVPSEGALRIDAQSAGLDVTAIALDTSRATPRSAQVVTAPNRSRRPAWLVALLAFGCVLAVAALARRDRPEHPGKDAPAGAPAAGLIAPSPRASDREPSPHAGAVPVASATATATASATASATDGGAPEPARAAPVTPRAEARPRSSARTAPPPPPPTKPASNPLYF
jgi:serine/threonine-protein kinase